MDEALNHSPGRAAGSTARRRVLLLLAGALAVVLGVLLVALLNTVPVASNDLWLQLKVGALIADTGHIPRTVLFPFTSVRDNVFTAHEWLPSLLFHEFVRVFGEDRLNLLQGGFGLLQFALSAALARRLSGSLGFGLLAATLAMLVANYRYVLRPEIFALLLLVCQLGVLTACRDRGRPGLLAWCVPIALAWANMHGSFLLGPLLAGTFALGEGAQAALRAHGVPVARRMRAGLREGAPYAGAMLAMVLASVANPRGAELLRFAFSVQASQAMRTMIKEWLPTLHPLFVQEPAFWIFVLVGAAALGLVVLLRRQLTVTEALLLAAFTALALQRNRHVVWFGFVALVVCCGLVGRSRAAARHELALRWAACALAALCLALGLRFGNARGATPDFSPSNNFSAPMIAELAAPDMRGNVFNSYELGSEIIYRDWPRLKPVIDSRIDSYGDDYFLFFNRLLLDQGLLMQFLDAAQVDHMLLLRRDFDARVRFMPTIAADWHVRLGDERMLLLERNHRAAPAAAVVGAASAPGR